MGVTRLPDASEILGPALQQISGALVNYLQPNRQFQKTMQAHLGENPELVLKFADLEAKNPGILAKLGFSGSQTDAISGVPESAAGELDRTTKPQQVAAGKAQIAAKTSEAEVTATENQAIMKVMQDNPNLTYQAAKDKVTGPSRQAALQNQEIDIGTRRQALVKSLPDLGTIDFYDQARKFRSGQLTGQQAAAYMSNPETAQAFQDGLQAVYQQDALAQQRVQHAQSQRETAAEKLAAKQLQNAYITWQKSGMAGDIDTWQSFMYDPETQTRAADLLSGKIKPANYKDEQILEVAQAGEKVGVSRFNRDVISLNNQITSSLNKIDKGLPDAERATTVGTINDLLDKRATLGGPKIKAVWRDIKWGRDRLEFVDEKGRPVDTDAVTSMLADPTSGALTSSQQGALDRIMALPQAQRAAALNKYKLQDGNGQNSRAVEDEVKKRGGIQ